MFDPVEFILEQKYYRFIMEKKNDTYEYGCMMLYFDFPEMTKVHSLLQRDDLYEEESDRTYGLEDEPHVTLLYGLHDDEVHYSALKQAMDNVTFGKCRLVRASIFENDKYDVLKFDVEGEGLFEANRELKRFPYTTQFEEYHPHCTIGYIKKGKGQHYANLINQRFDDFELVPKHAVYSKPNGGKEKITVNLHDEY